MNMSVLSALEGLISDEVGLKLAELAAGVPREQTIVEIGSYKGKSAAYLGSGSRSGYGAAVFAVDPWEMTGNAPSRFGFNRAKIRRAFGQQVRRAGVADIVTPIQGFSVGVAATWDRPVGLLYIDGSHREADVRADWLAWSPHLAPGATVVFDDYRTKNNPGVEAVVNEIIAQSLRRWEFEPAPLAIGYPE